MENPKPDEVEGPAPGRKREKIGLIDTAARDEKLILKRLTPAQQVMREAIVNHFRSNKLKKYISEQLLYINFNGQIGETIRFLFNEEGKPPPNAPLEEIIAERMKIENHIRWLEALCSEMRNNLVKIREVEDQALELLKLHQEGASPSTDPERDWP